MILIQLAWRNIWRNGKRTAITGVSIALSTALLIVSFALFEGMFQDMVDNATRLVTGDAQIHTPSFLQDHSIYKTIEQPQLVFEKAEKANIGAVARSYGYGLVSSGSKSAGAKFWGVDPEKELQTFELAHELFQGSYLNSSAQRQVVLGRKLAKSLHAEIGSEIVAVVQAMDGSLGNELFSVVGVFKTVGDDIDRAAAVISQKDFDELFVNQGQVHELAFNAFGKLTPDQVVAALGPLPKTYELKSWRKILPQLSTMVDMFDASMWIFALVFYLAAGLGVMNTMLMATYERIREFGILKSIGASPWRIVRDVTMESFLMAVVFSLAGVLLGMMVAIYLEHTGIDLSGFGSGSFSVTGIAFDPVWRARIVVSKLIAPVVMMWVVCMLAALYPAWKAARLDPVRAMGHAGGF